MQKNGLSIIVPAYNEEHSLEKAIFSLLQATKEIKLDYEIVIVNDGSNDRTGIIAEDLVKTYPRMRVIHHTVNQMIGGAIISGIKSANYSKVIVSPVDSPLTTQQLKMFIEASKEADVVCGYRSYRKGYKWWMRFLSGIYRKFCITIFRVKLKDFTWISLYDKEKILSLNPQFRGIAFFPEVLVKSVTKGFKIKQIECEMETRFTGKPTVSRPSRIIGLLFETLRLWWHINLQEW